MGNRLIEPILLQEIKERITTQHYFIVHNIYIIKIWAININSYRVILRTLRYNPDVKVFTALRVLHRLQSKSIHYTYIKHPCLRFKDI